MNKKNLPLIAGLSIPVLMMALVAISIYIPRMFAPKAKTDFVYCIGGYGAQNYYSIQNGVITQRELLPHEKANKMSMSLYLHDMPANVSREISLAEAQKMKLDSREMSPEGFAVLGGVNDYGLMSWMFFGGGGDRLGMYLAGHNSSQKLKLAGSGQGSLYYYKTPHFLGWVEGSTHE